MGKTIWDCRLCRAVGMVGFEDAADVATVASLIRDSHFSANPRCPFDLACIRCSPDGVASHVVCTDPQAHRELLELCSRWHREKPNSLYVDWEQTLESYRTKLKQ